MILLIVTLKNGGGLGQRLKVKILVNGLKLGL